MKRILPDERESITKRVVIGGQVIYLTWGWYDDKRIGEISLKMQKEGSTLDGFARCFGIACSDSLQSGTPFGHLAEKFKYQDFEPNGVTNDPDLPFVKSIPDYIFRRLAMIYDDQGYPRPKPRRRSGLEIGDQRQ